MYDVGVSSVEQQRNLRDPENIIRECIRQSIRKLLPVKHIIKEYLEKMIIIQFIQKILLALYPTFI